jgi:hypothetical protein
VSLIQDRRRAQRRAESRLFEAVEAADAGELRLAEELLDRAAVPRRARRAVLADERAAIRACPRPTR